MAGKTYCYYTVVAIYDDDNSNQNYYYTLLSSLISRLYCSQCDMNERAPNWLPTDTIMYSHQSRFPVLLLLCLYILYRIEGMASFYYYYYYSQTCQLLPRANKNEIS